MEKQDDRRHRSVHRKRHGRLTLHILVVLVALGAIAFAAARYPSVDYGDSSIVPTYSLSGVIGGVRESDGIAFFHPGTSIQTRDSVAALIAPVNSASVRVAGSVSPASAFSSGVAIAAARSGENAGGITPLADILDPQQPFALYAAQPGDSASSIAQRYGISVQTLLENNPTAGDVLLVGEQLVVPRTEGILYKVGHGDTVDSIVEQYDNVTSGIVIEYRPNAITDPTALRPGEYILLPGAKLKPPPPPPPPPPAQTQPSGTGGSGGAPLPGGSGRFTYPLAQWRGVSDPFGVDRGGGTYHTGIDLDLYGLHHSTIFSACTGVVSRVEYLTYSYGYHVIVDCGDGWSTLYAHMSEINVSVGQPVSNGTPLGVSGVTGYTTGEHLHFEIRKDGAAVNPADYLAF